MKKILSMILSLFICSTSMAQVIDPSDYFGGWPWTNGYYGSWQNLDGTYGIVYQIWYSLEDRCNAAGVYDLPFYSYNYKLSCGVKTNWSYSNWVYKGSSRMVTNNSMTNFYPTLQLTMTTNLINRVQSWEYKYPQNPGEEPTVLNVSTAYPYMSSDFLYGIYNAIETICPLYMPASADISDVNSNGPAVYCMAGLFIDAGLADLTSNVVSNDLGIVISGDWAWREPVCFPDIAACIAQLKKVVLPACSCSPYKYSSYAALGPNWGWDGINEIGFVITNMNPSRLYGRWPFAWMQQSLDETNWIESLVVESAWTNEVPAGSGSKEYLGYSFTRHHADWPTNGWYGKMSVDIHFDVTANIGMSPPTRWKFSLAGGDTVDNLTTISYDSSIYLEMLPTNGQWYISSYVWSSGTGDYYWVDDAWYDVYTYYQQLVDSSTYEEVNYTYTQYSENTNEVPAGSTNTFYLHGKYWMMDTNGGHTIEEVVFTNDYINSTSEYEVVVTGAITNIVSSNLVSLDVSTVYTSRVSSTEFAPGHFTDSYGGGSFSHTNQGTAAITDSYLVDNGVWCFAFLSNIRVSSTNLWQGAKGTGTLYLAGASFGIYPAHKVNTYNRAPWEWEADELVPRYKWEFTAPNEYSLTGGKVLTQKGYTNVFTTSVLNATEDEYGYLSLFYTNFSSAENYIPYLNDGNESRLFWGISNGFWIIDYSFTNHYE